MCVIVLDVELFPHGETMAQSSKRNLRKKSDIALPGEKAVSETSQSVGVKRVNESSEAKRPLPAKAVDRRRDVAPGGPV